MVLCAVVVAALQQFSGEWEKDFEYYFEDADKTAKFFPGRVHAGFFSVFTDVSHQQQQATSPAV